MKSNQPYSLYIRTVHLEHRRRIYTEEKAKVIPAVWGTEHAIHPFLPIILVQNI